MPHCPYGILGISRYSNRSQIMQAYYKLMKKWHPCRHPFNEAKAKSVCHHVDSAFNFLLDTNLKRRYDLVSLYQNVKSRHHYPFPNTDYEKEIHCQDCEPWSPHHRQFSFHRLPFWCLGHFFDVIFSLLRIKNPTVRWYYGKTITISEYGTPTTTLTCKYCVKKAYKHKFIVEHNGQVTAECWPHGEGKYNRVILPPYLYRC